MATLITERTTIENPSIEQIAIVEAFPVDNGLTEDGPEGEITKGFWSKARTIIGKWADKHSEHIMKTGYWNLFRV